MTDAAVQNAARERDELQGGSWQVKKIDMASPDSSARDIHIGSIRLQLSEDSKRLTISAIGLILS